MVRESTVWGIRNPDYIFDGMSISENCDSTGACVDICPFTALTLVGAYVEGNLNSSKLYVDTGLCTGCRLCEEVCPTQAITINPEIFGGFSGNGGGNNNDGGNNNGSNDVAFTVIAPAITIDLKKRLDCFKTVPDNANTKYSITVHAHKGIGGGNKPGHAFITLEKSNGNKVQRLSYGFYPVSSLQSGTLQSVPSAIGEESGDTRRISHSRYSLPIDVKQFQKIVDLSLGLANKDYHLLNNNCVHYATDIFNLANPPTGQINNNGFITPDDLDTYLKTTKSLYPNQSGIDTERKNLLSSTNCNN